MQYAVTSKRKIAKLIEGAYPIVVGTCICFRLDRMRPFCMHARSIIRAVGVVNGWDDPRLFTIAALRRKGYPPRGINDFCSKVGFVQRHTTSFET